MCQSALQERGEHRNQTTTWGEISASGTPGRVTDVGLGGDGTAASSKAALGPLGSLYGGHLELGIRMKSSNSKLKGAHKNVTNMGSKSIAYGRSSQSLLMNKCN